MSCSSKTTAYRDLVNHCQLLCHLIAENDDALTAVVLADNLTPKEHCGIC